VSDELAQRYEIATRPGTHCAPRLHRALGTDRTGAVRFSFSWYNTETEVRRALEALKEISESIRN
jgi:selenocysteine lyase/cysteine desulfurase